MVKNFGIQASVLKVFNRFASINRGLATVPTNRISVDLGKL